MRKLLNTLYVTSENSYLSLDGENVVVLEDQKELGRIPLHNLEGIVSFGYRGTSPALMGACAERNISLCYLTPQGKFLARVSGRVKGNVILREQQYADLINHCLIFRCVRIREYVQMNVLIIPGNLFNDPPGDQVHLRRRSGEV